MRTKYIYTQEEIDERVLRYLEQGNSFYVVDLNKYDNNFINSSDLYYHKIKRIKSQIKKGKMDLCETFNIKNPILIRKIIKMNYQL